MTTLRPMSVWFDGERIADGIVVGVDPGHGSDETVLAVIERSRSLVTTIEITCTIPRERFAALQRIWDDLDAATRRRRAYQKVERLHCTLAAFAGITSRRPLTRRELIKYRRTIRRINRAFEMCT